MAMFGSLDEQTDVGQRSRAVSVESLFDILADSDDADSHDADSDLPAETAPSLAARPVQDVGSTRDVNSMRDVSEVAE